MIKNAWMEFNYRIPREIYFLLRNVIILKSWYEPLIIV